MFCSRLSTMPSDHLHAPSRSMLASRPEQKKGGIRKPINDKSHAGGCPRARPPYMHEPPPPIRDGGFIWLTLRLVLAFGPEQTSANS
jgi:hypothetical protein